jgi:valyl-tRNA synthetase
MEKLGFFEGREDREIPLKFSDRSKTPIEPYLSDQWFVRMDHLAQIAIDAVNAGRVKFHPERYQDTYLDWLGEKRDWCISRQLWWGHRIPVWTLTLPPDEGLRMRVSELDEILDRVKELGDPNSKLLEMMKQRTALLRNSFPGETAYLERYGTNIAQQFGMNAETSQIMLYVAIQDSCDEIEKDLERLGFVQEEDVLDTWFSSALWPHSTLGWPEKTPELQYYYPTNTLVTSRDIITLWVARMVMTGLYNCGEVPFKDVVIHPKILDGFGETMSKMKGNGIDPLDIIERYGTDALRFLMVYQATENQDSRMPVSNVCPHCDTLVPMKQEHLGLRTRKITCPACKKDFRPGGPWPSPDPSLPTAKQASERFEMGRNFANKLWNATRFLIQNLEGYTPAALRLEVLPIEDRWILSRLSTVAAEMTAQLEGFHFSEAARTIYDFTWGEFCGWYLEMSKGRLRESASRAQTQRVLVGVLDAILRMVHPIMPFVTESIWHSLADIAFERGLPEPEPAAESICIAPWPTIPGMWKDKAVETGVGRMQRLVHSVREIRNRYPNIAPRTPLNVFVRCSGIASGTSTASAVSGSIASSTGTASGTSEASGVIASIATVADDFMALKPFIALLAGVDKLECGPDTIRPKQSATSVQTEFEAYVSLEGLIDVAAEIKRLEKQLAEKSKHLQATSNKLNNSNFVANAPPDVVQQQKDLVIEMKKQIGTIEDNLRELRQG